MQPAHPGCSSPSQSSPRQNLRWEVADILRLYGEAYQQTHYLSPTQQRVMQAIVECRTARLGGHAETCPQCGFERYAYNSCGNRHCPKCQSLTKAQWVADRRADLLPVPYSHAVFTLPHELNPLVLSNKRLLLSHLFQSASQTLLQFGGQNLGGRMGAIMVLHTWDQQLRAHFHVHCLVPAGALAFDGTQWLPTPSRFLFPVHALSAVFRGKFLDALDHAHATGTLAFSKETLTLATSKGYADLRQQLYAKPWIVYAKRPLDGPEQVLDYLGRYTHRVAIANHRLIKVHDGRVRFTYRNRRRGNRVQSTTLSADEFMGRFFLHVLPLGFQRLRHVGFLANRSKAKALPILRELLAVSPEPPPREKKTAAEWVWQLTGTDITQCPQCGHRPLQRTPVPPELVPPPRAPP